MCAFSGDALAQGTPAPTPEALPGQAALRLRSGFTERFRLFGGFAHEKRGSVEGTDYFLAATPEISAAVVSRRSLFRATYAVTTTLHKDFSLDAANRVGLALTTEPSRRTNLNLSADATQSTVTNRLITTSADQTPVGVLTLNPQILSVSSAESLGFELTPLTRFSQTIGGTFARTLDAEKNIYNYVADAGFGIDRVFGRNDSLGIEARGSFSSTRPAVTVLVPDPQRQRLITATLAPRWRHDITTSLSSSVDAGPTIIASPDPSTSTKYSVAGRGALLYRWDTADITLSYQHGFAPNALTGQVQRSHQATLRGVAPISLQYRIFGNAVLGYQHGTFINLREDAIPRSDFDAVVADLEIGWAPIDWLQPFFRYQFLAQTSGAANVTDPPLLRNAFILGVQLSTAPPGVASTGPNRLPERVDGADAQPLNDEAPLPATDEPAPARN